MSDAEKDVLEALGDAYDEARYGGIGDGGGSEPLWRESGARVILERLRELGYDVVKRM